MNFKRCLLSWSGALLLAGGCHSAVEGKIDAMKESGVVKLNEAGVIDYADLSPMDDLPTEIGGRDPVEGFNRAMFATNDVFMRYLFRPVGYVYGSIFPEPAVMAFNRFTDNLGFPARMISAFCQARFQAGGIEFVRFLGNTTIGIVGFFDPATAWFDLPRQDSDFGQAFASWGIGPGCYLFLPGAGPTNVRDGVGKIFDYALDPKTYFYGGQAFTMLNKGMTSYRDYETLVYANFDPYLQMRDLSLLTRRMQLERWKPETTALPEAQPAPAGPVQLADYPEQGGDVNTLRAALFDSTDPSAWTYLSVFNGSFGAAGLIRDVQVLPGKPAMEFKFWPVADNRRAPLLIILPGLGSHYTAATAAGLAELAHQQGYAVVVLSNAMHWAFATTATDNFMPGFTPADARAIRQAINAVVRDLNETERCFPADISLLGYSLGGLETLFIASQPSDDQPFQFRRYIAINPPVDLLRGLQCLDDYYASMPAPDADAAADNMVDAAGNFMMTLRNKNAEVGYWGVNTDLTNNGDTLLFTDEAQARFLIGYSFRRSLQELLIALHKQQPLPVLQIPYSWWNRHELYREISRFGYEQYLNEVLLPFYERKVGDKISLPKFNELAGLHAVEETLRDNPKIRVLHNGDDFLTDAADRTFLQRTLGSRLTLFNTGGHLGNFFHPTVQQALRDALSRQPAAK